MDFHALPRRDLQALCKRNGVRANMTNAAMADALRALPTVDGVEEYVKQPAAVPEPAVLEEEVLREKQGSPLPRGRRVTAKTSEVVKPDEGKSKEEEKADANRESNREDDAPVLAAGRRGASRRARPAPVVAAPAAEPEIKVAAEKQGSPPPRARRATVKSTATHRPSDGVQKEDLNREANKENAPVRGAVRRGTSQRVRTAPVVAAPAAEEKPPEPIKPDDSVEVVEEVMNQEKNNDVAPDKGVERRGPSRRSRPSPVVSKPAAKAVVEDGLLSPPPRGRRVATSIEGGEDDEKEEMQRDAVKENVPALAVGRRGGRGRARPEPVVPASACDVAAEADAPITRGRRGKAKALEPIRLNDGEEEDRAELKPEVKEEDVPAHGVARRGLNRRACPAPVEARAKRRSDAPSVTEERDVPVEAVLVRPSRVRKPTMKAAAADVKVPRRTTKKAAARQSTLQEEKRHDEPREAVPVPKEGCYDLGNVEEAGAPHNVDRSEVIDEPMQEDEDALTLADEPPVTDEVLMEESLEEPPAIDQECTGNLTVEEEQSKDKSPVEEQQVDVDLCATLPNLADEPPVTDEVLMEESLEEPPAIDQECTGTLTEEEEQSKDKSPVEEQQVDVDLCATLPNLADEPPVIDEVLMEESLEEPPAIDQECTGTLTEEEEQSKDKSPVEEQQVDVDLCATLPNLADEPPVTDEVLMEESLEEPPAIDQECTGTLTEEEEQSKDKSPVEEQQVDVDLCATLPNLADEPPVTDEVLMEESLEEPPAIDQECTGTLTEEEEQSKDKSPVEEQQVDVDLCATLPSLEEEPPVIHQECTGNLTLVEQKSKDKSPVEEQLVDVDLCATWPSLEDSPVLGLVSMFAEQTVEEDEDEGAHFQEGAGPSEEQLDKGMYEENHHADEEIEMNAGEELEIVPFIQSIATMDEDVAKHCFQTDFDGEKAEMVTDKLPQSRTSMDDYVKEDNFRGDDSVHVDEQKFVVDLEKAQLVTDKLPLSTATLDEEVEEDFQTDFFHVEQKEITTADSVQEVTKEMQQSTATMDEADVSELTGTDDEVHEVEKAIEIIEQVPQSIGSMNVCAQEGVRIDFVHTDELKKVVAADDMLEATETKDKAVQKESAFAGDITSALLDDITESLSMITITESTVSRDEDVPMCKNSIERNTDEPACKNKSENTDEPEQCKNKSEKNTAEPVAMQENMGLNVAKKPADLNVLSLRKLRAEYKKKMERKEAKRVALAKVDENVCRSNTTRQEQVRKLQQY